MIFSAFLSFWAPAVDDKMKNCRGGKKVRTLQHNLRSPFPSLSPSLPFKKPEMRAPTKSGKGVSCFLEKSKKYLEGGGEFLQGKGGGHSGI